MTFDPKQLDHYPLDAGIYIMKDSKGSVLYVGKANSLRKRLKQYFAVGRDNRAMIPLLISEIASIETIIVSTEKEALLLENTHIKKHQPKFNILLKDDKNYISLSINPKELWPRLKLVRLKEKPSKSAIHFGPYTSTYAARQTYELMTRLFPLRQCSDQELKRRTRPCLLYSMKKCIAPCVDKCSKEEYDLFVHSAIEFLKGNNQKILKDLTQKMKQASDDLEFEKAGALLSTIKQIEHVTQEKTVFGKSQDKSIDAIGFYREADKVLLARLLFREGKLIDKETFSFSQILSEDPDLLSTFLLQHYSESSSLPEEILLPFSITNSEEILSILQDMNAKAKSLKILAPQKGDKKDLIELAKKNAEAAFIQKQSATKSQEALLFQLQEVLFLRNFPKTIECFDTSNLSGSHLVASSVCFSNGAHDRNKMRLYHVKGIDKPDDYGALRQVLTRRILRGKKDDDFPDLFIIDGGKGQLGVALDVLKEHDIVHIDVVSLVKEKGRHDKGITLERVFVPEKSDSISFPFHSPLLFLLQKIRDTAHEKAISFYRKTHSKKILKSAIDTIPGIGPVKKKRLLQAFESFDNILKRSEKELLEIEGITTKDVMQIKKFAQEK